MLSKEALLQLAFSMANTKPAFRKKNHWNDWGEIMDQLGQYGITPLNWYDYWNNTFRPGRKKNVRL